MELLEGKSYTLNIDAKEFAEKTWRNALAELIKNNGYITIDRIAIGDTEDIAYVLQDDFEYEIPSHIWKYFKPYDLPEEEPKIATKEEIAAPDLNFVSSDPKMWMTVKPVQQDINDLRFDYPLSSGSLRFLYYQRRRIHRHLNLHYSMFSVIISCTRLTRKLLLMNRKRKSSTFFLCINNLKRWN